MVSHNIKRLSPPKKYSRHFSNAKIQPNNSLSVANHLLSKLNKNLEKYSIRWHSLNISYSRSNPVAKPEVSARTFLG